MSELLPKIRAQFEEFVLPTYTRYPLAFTHGEGIYLWDTTGKRYLDFGGGIAVCALGHAHPELADAVSAQARRLTHVSNLYYHEWQGALAERLVRLIAPGRIFFCNSGAEANEGLYKLARRFGHAEGRYEIITALGSFHGRTLASIAATGQEKVKKGFDPVVPGFKHVAFNDLTAMSAAVTDRTAAILIESIQGEGGVTVAAAEYLRGLRTLCDERGILLLLDEIQAGHFRTGEFHGWQRIAGRSDFLPDAISLAKSLGGGFPIGAFWVREKFASLLEAGSHGTTFGGAPLGCAVALKVLEIVERDQLAGNARDLGEFLKERLESLRDKVPGVIADVRGFGLMLGLEVRSDAPGLRQQNGETAASQIAQRLHGAGLLTIPAGTNVIRLLPPLNVRRAEAEEALALLEQMAAALANSSS